MSEGPLDKKEKLNMLKVIEIYYKKNIENNPNNENKRY